MTVAFIGNIVFAVASTEFITCIVSRKFIFQRESYKNLVGSFERAKARRDKTVASLAAKKDAGDKNKTQQRAQKTRDKDAKRLQRDEQELSVFAAELARRHTMATFYSSIAFLILYRILAAEYAGKVVGLLPFDLPMLHRITFRGLSPMSVAEVHSQWMQFTERRPEMTSLEASTPLFPDVTSAGQARSFASLHLWSSRRALILSSFNFLKSG